MKLTEGFAFGINEVVMTVLCGISGYLSIPRKQMLYFLIVLSISSIVPDVYAYYQMQRNETPENRAHSVIESLKNSYPIMLAELCAVFIIAIPLMAFTNKFSRALGAVIAGVILIIVTKFFSIPNANLYQLISPAIFAVVAAWFTYIFTKFLKIKNI